MMRIGELAKRTGLTVETLRFYERAGVLRPALRNAVGHREYDENAYRTLVAVRWGQSLGLSLEDIALLLGYRGTSVAERLAAVTVAVQERAALLREEQRRITLAIEAIDAMQRLAAGGGSTALPLDGLCVVPTAFVDGLVREHERAHPAAAAPASKPAPTSQVAPRSGAKGRAARKRVR